LVADYDKIERDLLVTYFADRPTLDKATTLRVIFQLINEVVEKKKSVPYWILQGKDKAK